MVRYVRTSRSSGQKDNQEYDENYPENTAPDIHLVVPLRNHGWSADRLVAVVERPTSPFPLEVLAKRPHEISRAGRAVVITVSGLKAEFVSKPLEDHDVFLDLQENGS